MKTPETASPVGDAHPDASHRTLARRYRDVRGQTMALAEPCRPKTARCYRCPTQARSSGISQFSGFRLARDGAHDGAQA